MKLPKNLASRYTQMTDEEMAGDANAAAYLKNGMAKGGRPGPIEVTDDSKALLRPGVLKWNDDGNQVMIDLNKNGGGAKIGSARNLNLSKILASRYVQQQVRQGHDVDEFPDMPTVSTAKAEAKAAAKADPLMAAKAAAKVEAKATALAAKAKATKEKALEGLGYYFAGAEASALAKHKTCILVLAVLLGVSLWFHRDKLGLLV